ncbi:tripartite tricarboxylate transporter substrate binding protein [Anaerotruncus rubiinfantis]|uniref:tripartite tricarboxylate transporter substrate binding protein n=1 Tax=Anaerotruncus rubiinfantis TaxID=1720200 RepID=UPI0034A4804B
MNKSFKQILSVIVILAMVVALSACNNSQPPSNSNVSQTQEPVPAKKADFPKGQIEMIVPYKAGGGTDNAARIIADALTEKLGQKVVIVNKAGAGGEIGFEAIANAEPDGYTIGVLGSPDHMYLSAVKETEYTLDDFDNLAVYNLSLPVLVARKDSFKSMDELIEYGKANPGKVTFGVSGGGPKTEAAVAMHYGGFEGTIVDFPGSADVTTALLGGHVDLACLTPSYFPTLIPEGCVPLAYFSEEKIEEYSDIPSFVDMGHQVNIAHNPIFVLPAGVPEDIRAVIMDAMEEIGADPTTKEKFEALNVVYSYMSGEELDQYLDGCEELITTMVGQYSEIFSAQ